MSLNISRAGVKVDWDVDLPFKNRVGLHFTVDTGLQVDDPAQAFEIEGNTHLWLLFSAASLAAHHSRTGRLLNRLIQPWQGAINDGFHDALCQALWDADHRAPYNDPLIDLIPTWKSHFYDPDTRGTWTGETHISALTQGCYYYRQSLDAYRSGDLRETGYALGLAVHYLSDMTQPMHAANFTWFHSQSPGYHTDFERYAKTLLPRIEQPRVYKPLCADKTTPEVYFHTVARYSKDTYLNAICKTAWTRGFSEAERADAVWERRVGGILPHILHDAIQHVAQFLLLWARDAEIGRLPNLKRLLFR